MVNAKTIIPIYTSRGDVKAFLAYPNIFNLSGDWIGWVTQDREVYSVLGFYVGYLSNEPRILRQRFLSEKKNRLPIPDRPARLLAPPTVPLAPLMKELYHGTIDVLLEEADRLHTVDHGELMEDID